MIRKTESLLFTVNQQNEKQISSEIKSRRTQPDCLNWSQPIEMLILLSRLFRTGQGSIIDGNKGFASS